MKKDGTYLYHRVNHRGLYILLLLILCPGVFLICIESEAGLRLDTLELAFSNGKNYMITPMNSRRPDYYLRIKASGRGTLTGQWLLDQHVIGLFEVFFPTAKAVRLRGRKVPRLPTNEPGLHELTIVFTNYNGPDRVPVLRYFVVERGTVHIQNPKPGSTVQVPVNGPNALKLQWQVDKAGKYARLIYQLLISETPVRFLPEDRKRDLWKTVGRKKHHYLDLDSLQPKRKRKKWIYWMVRAVTASGKIVTTSEISSFKLLYE